MENVFIENLKHLIGEGEIRPFARKVGVTETSIRNYLKGTEPRISIIYKIAEACQVSIGWLAAGEGAPVKNGEIAATISPGDKKKGAWLIAQGKREERRSDDVRRIVAWMDREEEKNPDFGWLLGRQLEKTNPSYREYLDELEEKKRDGDHYQVAEPHDGNENTA